MSKARLAIIALIIANIIWGAAPPIFKWALRDIGPFSLAFFRFSAAALLIFPFARKHLAIKKKDFLTVFFLGFFGVTVNIAFFFLGLAFAPSINASVIGCSAPIILIISSLFFLKEKLKKKMLVGALIGLSGILLIIARPLFMPSAHAPAAFIGNIFFVLGLTGAIGQTIVGKKIIQKYKVATLTFWTFFIGAVSFIPLFLHEVTLRGLPNATLPTITGIVFGAILSSCAAYFLFYWALKYLKASETGIFIYIDPIVTVAIAAPLLGEIPDITFLIGAFFVFLGIFIAEGRIHYHPVHRLLRR